MPYFVPEEGIDIEPLAGYVRGLLDNKARVRIGSHPARREQKGFWVESVVAIGVEDIRAMIEDTRLWRKENADGYYVNSATMRRRKQVGRPQAAKERPIAPMKTSREAEDPRVRQGSRSSLETEPRYPPSNPVTRASADNVAMAQRPPAGAAPSPRPASAQPAQVDPRRPSNAQQYQANPGYIQATAQYTISANVPQAQYSSYDNNVYDMAPPPYSSDTKWTAGGGGNQPSTTGTQGFSSMYATSGGPPRAPNQGQRRHEPR
ncbi:hypothetical protein LTR64_001855 [Lithohypha guttulata]|uniref:uncharacterized protein n=1 Tax=Lithohypha guttulata TaxID=1690604 RepID=UPI002DE121A9|nr:hypothetical protein LTR51_007714 [Lithohypha guttulata]